MNRIPVLFISYDRKEYTRQAFNALMETTVPIQICWWDNGSTDGTREMMDGYLNTCSRLLMDEKTKHRVHGIQCDKNLGINEPFNHFIRGNKDVEFLAKVDNDTIVEPTWLEKLIRVMSRREHLDVCGAFMQRPPGQWTFQKWVDTVMVKEIISWDVPDLDSALPYLAYNSYTGGTGVLFRTKIFHEYGLLYSAYNCLLGDFTLLQRQIFNGKNIAWFSGTTVKLLNIKVDGKELSNDYPEYDQKMKKVRDEGNKWYSEMGGVDGLRKWVESRGGREKL